MTAATFMSGLHYVIDVIASLPMFAASLALYKWWGNRLAKPILGIRGSPARGAAARGNGRQEQRR